MNLEGYPKMVVLKDGRELVLRPMVRHDAHDLRKFFLCLTEKEKLFVRDDDIDPVIAVPWPADSDYDRVLPILALDGEKVVGAATLHHPGSSWATHVGSTRITVDPGWRRRGLGRILAGELFRNALQAGLEKIMAEIVQDQVDVSLFYTSLGFHTEANLSGQFLDEKGYKHDVLIMSNNLQQLWKIWVEDFGKTRYGREIRAR
jgi:GNAT superfamily N-acetyltransferase